MTKYKPPIASRSTEELIIIAGSTTDVWQQDAIDQAKAELKNRGVALDVQKKAYKAYEKIEGQKWEEELARRKVEDFELLEKVLMAVRWPRTLFRYWGLKEQGYELKAKKKVAIDRNGYIGVCFFFSVMIMILDRDPEEMEARAKGLKVLIFPEWEKIKFLTKNCCETIHWVQMNEIDDDTIQYVMAYCHDYFTPGERAAHKHYFYGAKAAKADSEAMRNKLMAMGLVSKDPEVLKLLEGGQEEFQRRVTMRIVKEHGDALNKCPMCGKLTRTPRPGNAGFAGITGIKG